MLGLCGVTICRMRFSDTSIAFESPTQATYKCCSIGRYKTHRAVVPATIFCKISKLIWLIRFNYCDTVQSYACKCLNALQMHLNASECDRGRFEFSPRSRPGTHQFFRFFNEFVIQIDKRFPQRLGWSRWIMLAGRNLTMHMRYGVRCCIGATVTIEYRIIAGAIRVLQSKTESKS